MQSGSEPNLGKRFSAGWEDAPGEASRVNEFAS